MPTTLTTTVKEKKEQEDSRDPWALLGRAREEMRSYDIEGFEAAVALLRQALAIEPGFGPGHSTLAETCSYWGFRREINGAPAQSHYNMALKHAAAALRLAPERADSHRAMAVALRRGENADPEQRKEQVLIAVDLNPNDADNWYEYWRAFGYDTSDSSIQRAVELDPENCGAWIDFGVALCEEGRFSDSLQKLTRALTIKPDNTLAAYNLAMVLDRLGEKIRARALLEQAQKKHPQDPLLTRGKEYLSGGGAGNER